MSYTHLSKKERIKLESYREAGKNQKDCARLLGRSASAICNEIRKNANKDGAYHARLAHQQFEARKWKPTKKINEDAVLQTYIVGSSPQRMVS